MKALVTGGAGFIGGHLSARLLADQHQVICVDDLSTGDYANIARMMDDPGFEFVQGSVLDAPLMDDLTARADTVFHLAAAVGVHLIMDRPLEALRTNVHGTETVLECAHRHGIRTLIASTSEVYGKGCAPVLREDQDRLLGSTLTRRWSYAEAKALDETLAHLYWRDLVAPTVIARLFNVAGPRQTGRYGMVIPRFVGQAIRGEPLTVHGNGTQTRSFCHVDDAVSGLIALIDHPAAYGEAFNIGRPEEVSIRQLAERVIALTGSPSVIEYVPYREAYGDGYEDIRRRVPDISRARNLVGFDPKLDLDDIIGSVVQDQVVRAKIAGNGYARRHAVSARDLEGERVR
ncbi:NAD-dependent epimerase/dehydratase family protein [Phytoactinopolyspora alkaliphila]|uniref:NAD-dependent epimerase/dehydratase family protein n=1 Tax=Phytoactinopolyspora alkaliphila TaxID=1783498 RepID=A0A6N9YTZ9_9ACTN|nr:NAD-dependent epimerase/dehydratase family protein [Phytoactinopolyspora alkaliphila]NED98521.1 NAD-dependent epimerase/dehydratase family protein [Phytoactinopolyspora alkaliphila]